jgi:hypothetical protein
MRKSGERGGAFHIPLKADKFLNQHWSTEGFDTADLKDAKALLDELRR